MKHHRHLGKCLFPPNQDSREDRERVLLTVHKQMENADGVDIVIDAGDGVEDHWFDVQEAMIADNNDINNVNENVPDAADLVRGPGQSEPLPFDSKPKKRENLDHPLFPGISATKFECLLAIFHFAMRHDLSMTGEKKCYQKVNLFSKMYLGEYKSFINATSKCDVCDNINSVNSLKSSNFFVYIPMEQQLRSLFESNPDIMDLLGHRFNRNVSPDQISDIFDGSSSSPLLDGDGKRNG
ncbi:Putative F-box/kelch-repeat protein [Frankliniella fusca]|uniref:F-box/kelch-repeat protein n=1 Tax=Frankliniella fusca TaxID=407009 RepID=A0AAE1GYZ5_9NEOP|nr:Putative F-box/kelch-repeat protein [Frankliniella fusca]